MSRNMQPERSSGQGRHGKAKSEEEALNEMKAKGHAHKPQAEQPGEEFEARSDRGNQKGYGKNQGKEATERSTAFGTRAPGAHHG